MAKRKTNPKGPKSVEAITHADKRVNLPTADAQEFVAPETEARIPLRYPRNPSLDPQLVWKGKDELAGEDLVARRRRSTFRRKSIRGSSWRTSAIRPRNPKKSPSFSCSRLSMASVSLT